jgi:hypothetical protein
VVDLGSIVGTAVHLWVQIGFVHRVWPIQEVVSAYQKVIMESCPKYASLLDFPWDKFQFVILPKLPTLAVQKHLAYFSVEYVAMDLNH